MHLGAEGSQEVADLAGFLTGSLGEGREAWLEATPILQMSKWRLPGGWP